MGLNEQEASVNQVSRMKGDHKAEAMSMSRLAWPGSSHESQ